MSDIPTPIPEASATPDDTPPQWAILIAARAWCADSTKHIVMDSALATEFAHLLAEKEVELERENTALLARLAAAEENVAWLSNRRMTLAEWYKERDDLRAQLQAATSRAEKAEAVAAYYRDTDSGLAAQLASEKQRADALERECDALKLEYSKLNEERARCANIATAMSDAAANWKADLAAARDKKDVGQPHSVEVS